jgi:hypothetical protein
MAPEERRTRGEQSFRYGSERFGLKPSADTLEQLLLDTIG